MGGRVRNQVLKRKLFQLKDQDELPPHIVDMFDNAHKHADGERMRKSEIINNMFDKKGKKWVVNMNKPLFQEAKTRSSMVKRGSLKTIGSRL